MMKADDIAPIDRVDTQATEASRRFQQALAMWDVMGLKDVGRMLNAC